MDILISVFLMGLLGGVHCLGMCGGIVGMLTAGLGNKTKISVEKIMLFQLGYNIGRILSYVLMGIVFGALGSLLAQMLQMSFFDNVLRALSSILMIMVGLYIGQWFFGIQILEKIGAKLWVKIKPISERFIPVTSFKGAFLVGLFWGTIPCGLVYSSLSFAMLSGSAIWGGLIMFAFGLGTLPSLLVMAGFSTHLRDFIQKPIIRKTSALLIITLGFWSLYNFY